MAFVAAMNTPALTKVGVKGSDVYTEEGVGDLRVALFTQLVRNQTLDYIKALVNRIVPLGYEYVRDLAVMAFQTRDIRGGKGERDIFYHLFTSLVAHNGSWKTPLLKLVPEYGCWKDLWVLHSFFPVEVDALVLEQFRLDQESERPSLLAKWLPREGSKHNTLAHHFAALLFPLTPREKRMRTYRRCLACLNRAIDTTEVKMCGKTWAAITPSHVPGRLMKRCKKAFFNQERKGDEVRWPEDKDRVQCAENFRALLKDVKEGKVVMKGAQTTMPHEHVHEIQNSFYNPGSVEEEETRQAQWNAIRDETEKLGGLGKIVPMCDFSGSMNGVPKEVSLALGILISEVASPAFRDHILTFDSDPSWHSFKGMNTLRDKVVSVGHLGQGLSTDFQKACDLILQKMVENKVSVEEAPTDLLVLTDMGFDYASGNTRWQTHFQIIREKFAIHGYQMPRIVCWNLRAEYKDFHAKAHEEGVVQISGWSPAVLKALQKGGVQVQTPYQAMRILLDDERYDPVRKVMDSLVQAAGANIVRDA